MPLISVQWELSNPQYSPDDSAPPVPNMTISSIETDSLEFQQTDNYYALHETVGEYGGLLDLGNFAGVPNTVDFDYNTGHLSTTVDHLFYSYLNVDTVLPPFRITSKATFDMYFKELIPASCGLYTIDIPRAGRHVMYLYSNNGNTNKFVYSGFGEPYSPETRTTTSARTTLTNHSEEVVENYKVVDFLIDFKSVPLSSVIPVRLEGVNYSLEFAISRYDIVFTVHRIYDDGDTYQVTHRMTDADLDQTIYCRFHLEEGRFTTQYTKTDNNITQVNTDFSSAMPSNLGLKINQVVMPTAVPGTSLAMQVIGYDDGNIADLTAYDDVVRPKSHYYPIVRYSNGLTMALPRHSGNMWAYINQLATTQPFQELL